MSKRIGVIIASVRKLRNADAIVAWLRGELATHQGEAFGYTFIDLAAWEPPHYVSAKVPAQRAYDDEFSKRWSQEIDQYDGFLVVTPEYNHGYSGVLKDAFDHLFHEWCFKPIAFVGYGTNGGVRAIEQMRQVAVQLNMAPIRRQITIPVWDTVESGTFIGAKRYNSELHEMLRQLEWWTTALANARARHTPVL